MSGVSSDWNLYSILVVLAAENWFAVFRVGIYAHLSGIRMARLQRENASLSAITCREDDCGI